MNLEGGGGGGGAYNRMYFSCLRVDGPLTLKGEGGWRGLTSDS